MAQEVGRPSLYDPSFCDIIVDLGKWGKSVVQMACHFCVSKDTLYEWAKVYPEFSDAFTRARQEAQSWWEDKAMHHLIENKDGPKLNTGLWSRSMAARFPAEYRESKDVNLGGQPDNPLTPTTIVIQGVEAATDDSTNSEQADTDIHGASEI